MENTKQEKSASDVLGGFFAKTQKFWIVFLILLVVVSVAVGVLVTVKNNANQKGANFLDAAVFSYFKSKSTLEGDELVAAEDKFLSDVKAFAETNGKNDNTVRANMMVAEIYYQKADWKNSLDYWTKAADMADSYLAGISYFNTAVCYEQLADVVNAEKFYSLALTNKEFELKPHAMFSLARVYETQGKIEQAISEYKNIMNTYSDSDWADLANSRLIVIDTAVVSE